MRKLRANPFTASAALAVHGPRFGEGKKLTLDDELYSRDEVTEALGIGSAELGRLIQGKDVPHVNFGGFFFFPVEDIDAMPKKTTTYEAPSMVEMSPVTRIAAMKKSGMSPEKIAKELLVDVRVVRKYLEGVGEIPQRPRPRRGLPASTKLEYTQMAFRPPPFQDTLVRIQYMHLNKFTPWDIAVTLDMNEDEVESYLRDYDAKNRSTRYVRRLESSMWDVIEKTIRGSGSYEEVAGEYGVSLDELAKFMVAHRNSWSGPQATPRYAFRGNPGIKRNPFTIKDGFRLFGSVLGKTRISLSDELLTLNDVPGFVTASVDDLNLLVEFDMLPHIKFGGEVFVPFAELDAMMAHESEGEMKDRIRWARHFKGLERNPAPSAFGWVVGVGLGLAVLGWWLSTRPA